MEIIYYEDKIFRNNLILASIFKNLNKKELLPLRLVSSAWNEAIIEQISKAITVDSYWAPNWETQFHYFKKLRIKNVKSDFCPHSQNHLTGKKETFAKFLEQGDQFFHLTISSLPLKSEEDFAFFINFLSRLRNLRSLILSMPDICVEQFSEHNFENRIFPSLREFKIELNINPDLALIVPKVMKIFPNLTSNFGHVLMDLEILRGISARRITNYEIDIAYFCRDTFESYFKEMNFLISEKGEMRVRRLVITNIDSLPKAGLDCVYEILRKLSNSLEVLELSCCNYPTHLVKREMKIPSLKKLRKLVLGVACILPDPNFSKPTFVWNLGKALAKDFPLLEHFKLIESHQKYSVLGKATAWEMWEPFLPTETDGVELEASKFLKYVDLALPKEWIGRDRQLVWGRKVANSFSRIYSSAGNESMKSFMDWVRSSRAIESLMEV